MSREKQSTTPNGARGEAMSDVDIQVAVMVGDRRAVNRFIKAGGDLEVKDDEGATPLCHAAFWTHVDVAKDLIDAGADVNAQRRIDGFTPLHVAAKNNQPRMINLLVGARADLNVQEDFGDTPLHWAYRSKATECIEILLAAGADTEMFNHEGKTPKECEGTGVERQGDDGDEEFDDTPSAGDASTVVGGGENQDDSSEKNPSRPAAGRSSAAGVSPRTTRNQSGPEPEEPRRAHFRVAYPPTIQAGVKWHGLTAYLFEPSASRAVRQADKTRVSGLRQPFTADDTVEDGDRAIPPGTDVTVRPRFPRTCCVNPVGATVKWARDVHALSFEVCPPASASSGTVTGSVDFYVGPILVGQAQVEMAVVTSSERTEEQDILGPVSTVFDTAYVCYAAPDEALILPYLERFKRLGIANLTWRPASGAAKETRDLIREASVFQICWSAAAQLSGRVKTELKYAASLAKSGSLAVRGIYWDPAIDATSVRTDHGLAFPLRLHNSFLLEEPCTLLAGVSVGSGTTSAQNVTRGTHPRPVDPINDTNIVIADHDVEGGGDGSSGDRGSAEAGDGCGTGKTIVLPEKLATPAVEHTRGHISRLRAMVGDASAVDVPRVVWLYPEDGKSARVNLETDEWLTNPVRVSFLCPVSMKPATCGEDGKGYLVTLPRGWGSKIGIALKIGVAITAAATDAGELTDLPVPDCQGNESSAKWQGQVVNAAYDGLTGAIDSKANESIDTAFLEADAEGTSMPPSTQLCTEAKRSYANLRTLLQKYDKGLHLAGLVKAFHGSTTEWVHPAVATLFRNEGPAIFEKGALKAADRFAVSAATRSSTARGTKPGHHAGGRGASSTTKDEVIDTLRLLEEQILAMGESVPASA